MNLNPKEVKIIIKLIDEPKLKAIISLDFGDFLVKGFRIITSKKYPNQKGDLLWFVPPAYNGGGKWRPLFFCPNKELWKEVESIVFEEYYRQQRRIMAERMDVEGVDLDNIFPK